MVKTSDMSIKTNSIVYFGAYLGLVILYLVEATSKR